MTEKSDELPEAVRGIDGESEIVAERSCASTPKSRRPVPHDPPEEWEEREPEEEPDEDEDVTRPDAGPTG
ncbi:hypothetical protein [Nonomuraea sp. NPDC049695]|uniref:hypothetical protein n=1 Tax=Nonomuraea sp. NPDC049695 TaxID=3154734 RepID=UPI003444A3AE